MNKTKFKFFRRTLLLCALIGLTIQGCKKENSEKLPDEITGSTKDRLTLSKTAFNGLYAELRKSNGKELPSNISNRYPEFAYYIMTPNW